MTATKALEATPPTPELPAPLTDAMGALSYSALTTHRECPQAWHYKYLRKLSRATEVPRIELDLGTWWHMIRAVYSVARGSRGPAQYEDPHGNMLTLGAAEPDAAYGAVEASLVAWWARCSEDYRQLWGQTLGADAPDHLRQMDELWRDRWADELAGEEPLLTEVRFDVSVPVIGEPPMRLVGTIDEVYRDRKRGVLVVRDYKTAKTFSASSSVDDLMDSQLHLYAWAASKMIGRELGVAPSAIGYDRIRSVSPKQPVLTSTGGLSKSVTDYPLATYLAFVEGGVPWGTEGEFYKTGRNAGKPKFGVYEADPAVVSKLSTPASRAAWHVRTMQPLATEVVRAHIEAAIDTYKAALQTARRVSASGRAARNLTRWGCTRCDFVNLCRAELLGGTGEYPPEMYGLIDRRK